MRRWVPVVATLGIMAVVVLGGFVVAGALAQEAGPPVVVADVVRIFPLSGWAEAGQGTVGDLAAARITRGTATLDVLTRPTDLGAEAVLVRYVDRFLEPASRTLSVSREVREVPMNEGVGLRVSYVGAFGDRAAEVEGEVTVIVSPAGNAAIFDAWGPAGQFGYAVADARAMVADAEVA